MQSEVLAKEPLAVFDVDGTLFRRGLLPALTRRLVDEGVFPERVREELSRDYYAWVDRQGSYEVYDELVVQLFLRELKGVPVAELRRCAKVEVEAHGRGLHIYTRDLASRLRQAGYYLVAISGSHTGEILHHPFSDKRGVLKEFLSEVSLSLEGSVGVGDTLSDVGFLEMVQTPIVFNPNHSFLEGDHRRGWPIVVE